METDRAEIGSFFKYFFIAAGIIFYAVFAKNTFADTSCVSAYGAVCPAGALSIEKKVQNPKTGEFVNVLGSSTAVFSPNSEVNFRIEVKNTGSSGLSSVFVQDRLPGNIKFVSAVPGGSFDQKNNILSWTIDSIGAGESKLIQVKVQVKSANELNFDIACMTNFVSAQKDAQLAQANAVFCIQAQLKTIPPVTETPRTGLPLGYIVFSLLLLPLGIRLARYGGR